MDFKGRIKKKRITKMPAEFKILERAEMYLRKLSCGVNPLTEENLSENDACKQERISKCLLYVADYIQQKIAPKNEKQAAQKPQKKLQPRRERELATAELVLNDESLAKFEYSEEPISVSGIVRKVNDLIPAGSGMMPLMYADVAEILSQEGVLLKQGGNAGKELNLPSPRGEELGFARAEEVIRGRQAVFTKCNLNAQKFILENMQKCIAQANERLAKRKAKMAEMAANAGDAPMDLGMANVRQAKEKFHLTKEEIAKYPSDETPVPVTEIARRLNDLLVPGSNIERIYFKTIRDWFVSQNLLEESKSAIGKISFVPTESGKTAGIVTESRIGKNGEAYDAVLYTVSAQKIVLEHVNEMR